MKTRNAPPRAGMLIESLRGLGYTTATAVADIIDNSISAGARSVDVHFEWAGPDSWIRITDDGCGMNDMELEKAMQLGASDPRHERRLDDLGRFGMGLKTASFSQARALTVHSLRADSEAACLRWDLDVLEDISGGDWPMIEGPRPGSEERLGVVNLGHSGTVVLWEDLDRIVTPGFTSDDLFEVLETLEGHLAMVFHRLIGTAFDQIDLKLNGKRVKPWDPFLMGNPSKRLESLEYSLIGAPEVRVQLNVLPHKDKFEKATDFEAAAGPDGWASQQGFYIYRNKRLLAVSGWLRLGERGRHWPRDEAHRLARIRLDIPNTMDSEWNINVLKSTASPPVRLRPQLLRLAKEVREIARNVYVYRGRLVADGTQGNEGMPDIWEAIKRPSGATAYRLSRQHDLYRSLMDRAGPLAKDIEALLRLVEGTVPVQRIWLDTSDHDEPPVSILDEEADPALIEMMEAMFDALVYSRGLSEAEARERLSRTRPFDKRADLIAGLGKK
ncbi:ATP-binding protein [Ruegeria sp. MALMAid1280]|uniref:ATP-binding protein n=1 Tax=Ruegeria sp. MALMAid1280 TaxID=3411634 RepID=UPI003BA0C662